MQLKIFIGGCLLILFSCAHDQPMVNTNTSGIRNAEPDIPLAELITTKAINADEITIFIDKSEYTLQLVVDTVIIKTYPVVFGSNPVDDKRREGDKCTPEGNFKVRDLYPHKKWSKFIWIDYPTEESIQKHNKSKANGEIEDDATIGGEIGIHGVPDNKDHMIDDKLNWTLGCISLKNKHVDEIYEFIKKGTSILIQQ